MQKSSPGGPGLPIRSPVLSLATQFSLATTQDPSSAQDSDATITISDPALAMMGMTSGAAQLRNTTVLPHIESSGQTVQLSPRTKRRYQRVTRIGSGAMGEVDLALDNDIGRKVAVKQLVQRTQNPAGVARFVEEIRTVGQLEHPNIVPIHDVGVDPQGQLFFVMKYIDGETLESIIEKLAAGDPAYLQRYTIDARIELFLGLLHALQYAHANGVVHRDIKPANVMVGRYGEVVLMDWGVAKVIHPDAVSPTQFATPEGTVVGTPAYMSPEQAIGNVGETDARSDIYSATVLFHELLALEHYLADCQTYQQIATAIFSQRFSYLNLLFIRHPRHPVPPAELLHFIAKGLAKGPAERFQSAEEMIAELQRIRDGCCRVKCPATLAKRMTDSVGCFVSRYPKLSPFVFYSVLLFFICYVAVTAYLLFKHGIKI